MAGRFEREKQYTTGERGFQDRYTKSRRCGQIERD